MALQDGRTPLHLAAEKGHPEIIKLLIDKGAKVDIKDNVGPSSATRQYTPCVVVSVMAEWGS